jgi:ketosteroid isomerase-like protein
LRDEIRQSISKSRESLVLDYFQRVRSSDLSGLLNLFSDDSVIYEPFSKSKCLMGKSEIEPFLRTVVMANKGMQYELEIEKAGQSAGENMVIVLVRFNKVGSITSKFRFEFQPQDESNSLKIKTIHIEFID